MIIIICKKEIDSINLKKKNRMLNINRLRLNMSKFTEHIELLNLEIVKKNKSYVEGCHKNENYHSL